MKYRDWIIEPICGVDGVGRCQAGCRQVRGIVCDVRRAYANFGEVCVPWVWKMLDDVERLEKRVKGLEAKR